jgi:hypothetical protein
VIKPGERPADRTQQAARERAAQRRKLAEIFGDVLPDQTSDDAEASGGADRRSAEKAQEDWLKSQVPPHHG